MISKLRILILSSFLAVLIFIIGCATNELPTAIITVTTPESSSSDTPDRKPWEKEWEKLIAMAKKEGTVVVYSTPGATVRQALVDPFSSQYGISLEWVTARGNETSERLSTQRKAGLYIVDVVITGSTTVLTDLKPKGFLAPLQPALILPDLADPAIIKNIWWNGELGWLDTDHLVLGMCAYPSSPLAINTELVKPGEIRSYRDLLAPRWKGKIVMDDPTISGTGERWFGVVSSRIMDLDFMRQLAKQEPLISRERRLSVEWLARGKYAVMIAPDPTTTTEFINVGATIDTLEMQEGTYLTSGGGGIALLDKAPHPNAANVFINWLLTKEGQSLFSQSYGKQSARLDVTAQGLRPNEIRDPRAKYYRSDTEEEVIKIRELSKMAREIFATLLQK